MAHRPLVTSTFSGSGTALVASSPGVLHAVTVTSPGTIELFDSAQASGRKVASLGAATGRFVFNEPFGHLALSVSGSAALSVEVRERRA